MKKIIVILLTFAGFSVSGQTSHYKALHLILQNVDTIFFDEEGYRWYQFSMPTLRAFTVMDLIEEGGTFESCFQIKGSKEYRRFLKYSGTKPSKFDKKVFAYLECLVAEEFITMWMSDDVTFGYVTVSTDFD